MCGAIGQSHEVQQFHSPFLCFTATFPCNIGRNHDILQCRELRKKLVELENEADMRVAEIRQLLFTHPTDFLAVYTDFTAIGLIQSTDNLQQCSFACTAGTYDAHHLSFIDMEGNAFEHVQISETLSYIFNINHFSLRIRRVFFFSTN